MTAVAAPLAFFAQGVLAAVGTSPGRCDCSFGRWAGASSLPENSSGERTSTRFCAPMAATTSSRKARMEVSCALALYSVFGRSGTSSPGTSSRASSSHFLRPPSRSLTFSWPYSLKYQ